MIIKRHSPSKAIMGICWCQKGLPTTSEYLREGFERGFRKAQEMGTKKPKVPKGGICWPCFLKRCWGAKKSNYCPCCRRGHT